MAVQIGAKPDSGFDDPLGILRDCHRRIERFLGVLCQVAEQARARPLTTEESRATEAALRYFRESGPRHNADEEESLFPRIGKQSLTAIERLESEHRQGDDLHRSIERQFRVWIATGHPEDSAGLRRDAEELRELYANHIRVEEEIVFPHAASLLDEDAVAAMGAEFKARRQ